MSRVIITRGYRSPERADFYIRETRPCPSDFQSFGEFTSSLDFDLAHLAHGLFIFEHAYREGSVGPNGTVTALVDNLTTWDRDEIKEMVPDILGLTLHVRPKIRFLRTPLHEEKTRSSDADSNINSVCLFSGGIDSLSGILNTVTHLGSTQGVFVSHTRKLKSCVELLIANSIPEGKAKIEIVNLPVSYFGLQQLRGFLYLSFAAIVARICGTDRIVVSETGPIMYQPELTSLDEVTVTTHPFLIRIAKRMFKDIYGLDFSFYEPFENLTKAEVIACCPDRNAIPNTHSCIITGYVGGSHPQCGNCYGCLLRRVSCIVAGVQDSNYGRDVFLKGLGESIEGHWKGKAIADSTMQDLRALLLFAREILENGLPDSTSFKIRQFKKEELFDRFALDVLAALYVAYDKEKFGRNSFCENFYERCIADRVTTKEKLSNRLDEVRGQKYKPDFTKKI